MSASGKDHSPDPVEIVHRALVEGGEDSGIAFAEASLTLKALSEAGFTVARMEQVGWYCNQAMGHGGRTQLCSHSWPCGPTFAKADPPEGGMS